MPGAAALAAAEVAPRRAAAAARLIFPSFVKRAKRGRRPAGGAARPQSEAEEAEAGAGPFAVREPRGAAGAGTSSQPRVAGARQEEPAARKDRKSVV